MTNGKVLYMHRYKKEHPAMIAWPAFLMGLTWALLVYISHGF